MKQIDIIRTYAQKHCLVVDDVPEARAMLKRVLVDFGVKEADTVGNAEEAIDLCYKKVYDIIIADYNLGQGKNGQQLLEELRFHGLLKNTGLFIMITAENASHYVLHALENAPDDFLQKPVNRDSLRPRLDLALLKNEYLFPIKSALDDDKPNKATAIASDLAHTPHRFQNDAKKILGNLLLQQNKLEDAEDLYQSVDEDRLPLWAELGLAKAHYQRKSYEDAEHLLQRIIRENSYCVEAYDLLARVCEATHRPNQSQNALMSAVKVSPRSAPRQRELGRVSMDLEDENVSVHAFRSALRHSKNSCFEAADDFVNLAEGLSRLAQKSDSESAQKFLKEAHESLAAVEKRYGKNPIVMMRCKLVEAGMLEEQGDEEAAKRYTDEAAQMHASMRYSVIENTAVQLCIDCAKAFMDRGRPDEGEAILQELARLNTDAEQAIKIDRLLREPKTKEGVAYAAKRNKEGIEFYEQGKTEAALRSFREVLREIPNHIGLNLNLIQALISKNKISPLDKNELVQLSHCFQRIGEIDSTSSYAKRFDYLIKRYKKLLKDPD